MAGKWTDKENRACVNLYRAMYHIATTRPEQRRYKAAMIRIARGEEKEADRELAYNAHLYRGRLGDRTKGSIELKLMNVTGAIHALGFSESMAEFGYPPMPKYQQSLEDLVARVFQED